MIELLEMDPKHILFYFTLLPSWFWSDLDLPPKFYPFEIADHVVIKSDQLITLSSSLKMLNSIPTRFGWEIADQLLNKSSGEKTNLKRFIFHNLETSDIGYFIDYLTTEGDHIDSLLINCLKLLQMLLGEKVIDDFDLTNLELIDKIVLTFYSVNLFSDRVNLEFFPEALYHALQTAIDQDNQLLQYGIQDLGQLKS